MAFITVGLDTDKVYRRLVLLKMIRTKNMFQVCSSWWEMFRSVWEGGSW
jgi:hypothetical protein